MIMSKKRTNHDEGMFKGAATAKGALIITPSKVIVTTPGADNKKEI